MLQKISDNFYINFNDILLISSYGGNVEQLLIRIRGEETNHIVSGANKDLFISKLDEYLRDLRHTLAAKGI